MGRQRGRKSPSRRSARWGKVCEGNVRHALVVLLDSEEPVYVGPYGLSPETVDELVRRGWATKRGRSRCELTEAGREQAARGGGA